MDTLRAYLRPLADILAEVFGLSSAAADGAALAVVAVVLVVLAAAVMWLFRKARHVGSGPTETLPAQKQLPADPRPDQAEPDLFPAEPDHRPTQVQDSHTGPGTHTDGGDASLAAEPERGPDVAEPGAGPASGNGTAEIESLFDTGPDMPDFSEPASRWGRRKRRGAPHDNREMGDMWGELGLEETGHEAGPTPEQTAAPAGEAVREPELADVGSRGIGDVGPPRLNTLASLEMLVGAVAIWADQERTRLYAGAGDTFDELVAAERQRVRASQLGQQLRGIEQERDAAAARQEDVEEEIAALDTSAPNAWGAEADPEPGDDEFTALAAAVGRLQPGGDPADTADLEMERLRLLAEQQQAQEAVVVAERRREALLADGEAQPWAPEGPGESDGDSETGRASAAAAVEEFGRTVALVAAAVRAMLDQMASAQSVEELASVKRPAFIPVRDGVATCAERADAAVGAAGSGAVAQARVAVGTAVSRFAADWDTLDEALTAAFAAADLQREQERVVAAIDTVSAAATELPTPEQRDAIHSQVAELAATRDALAEQAASISDGLAAIDRAVDAQAPGAVSRSLDDAEAQLGQLADDLSEMERSLRGLAVATAGVVRLLVEQNASVTAASHMAAEGRSAAYRAGLVVDTSRQLEAQLTGQYGPVAPDAAAANAGEGFGEQPGGSEPLQGDPANTDGDGSAVGADRTDSELTETFHLNDAGDVPDGGEDDTYFFPTQPDEPTRSASASGGEQPAAPHPDSYGTEGTDVAVTPAPTAGGEGEEPLDAPGRYGGFLEGTDQHLPPTPAAPPSSRQPDPAGYSEFVNPDGGVADLDEHDVPPEPFDSADRDDPEPRRMGGYDVGVDDDTGPDDSGLLPPATAQAGAAVGPDEPDADSDPSSPKADLPFAADAWQEPPQGAVQEPGQSHFNGLAPQNFTAASVPPELGGNQGGKRGRRNRRR